MKRKHWFRLVIVGLLLLGYTSLRAAPTSYQLNWFSIDSGGGVAQGGTYALAGSFGQPDAGLLAGGSYQLRGGFRVGSLNSVLENNVWLPMLITGGGNTTPPTPTVDPPTVTVLPSATATTLPSTSTSTAMPTATSTTMPTAMPTATATRTPTAIPTATPSAADFEAQVLVLVNQHRAQAGCGALTVDSRLRAAGYLHSQDMAVNNFISHTGSNGSTPAQRISDQGYVWNTWGENVAAGQSSPQAVVDSWMNSPGHRTNILNCTYTQTGIGYYFQANDQANVCNGTTCTNGPYYHYWTQVFARPQ